MDSTDRDRLNKLSSQLDAIRHEEAEKLQKVEESARGAASMSAGTRAGAELITCILAGAIVGWLFDKQFETQPVFLVIFVLTGIAMGFYEVYRITKKIGKSIGFAELQKAQKTATTPAEDD